MTTNPDKRQYSQNSMRLSMNSVQRDSIFMEKEQGISYLMKIWFRFCLYN